MECVSKRNSIKEPGELWVSVWGPVRVFGNTLLAPHSLVGILNEKNNSSNNQKQRQLKTPGSGF